MLDGISKKENATPSKNPEAKIADAPRTQGLTKKGPYLDSFEKKKVGRLRPRYKDVRTKIKIRKNRVKMGWFWFFASLIFLAALTLSLASTKIFSFFSILYSLESENILVGFQNSAELRPTGGFWGSFAIWQIEKNLQNSQILFETNVYKNTNPLLEKTNVEPPKPLKETWPENPLGFVNANWSFDFEQAAKTLEWYFGQAWQLENSGVIAISSLAVIDLLKLTGPVTALDGTQINSENFTQILSQKIDTEYWQTEENKQINEPKTILKEISPQIIQKAKNIPVLTLYRFTKKQLEEGRILCYFSDPAREKLCQKLGISGKLAPYSKDYLSINNANLNGGKTSLNVFQSIEYRIDRAEEDNITSLKIRREHMANSWPGILNRNFTRIITPLGSQLVSAKLGEEDITNAVEKTDEMGRTTFGFWFSTSPGETKTAEIQYLLPFSLKDNQGYNLVFQKQPGTLSEKLKVIIFDKILYEGENSKSFLKL